MEVLAPCVQNSGDPDVGTKMLAYVAVFAEAGGCGRPPSWAGSLQLGGCRGSRRPGRVGSAGGSAARPRARATRERKVNAARKSFLILRRGRFGRQGGMRPRAGGALAGCAGGWVRMRGSGRVAGSAWWRAVWAPARPRCPASPR